MVCQHNRSKEFFAQLGMDAAMTLSLADAQRQRTADEASQFSYAPTRRKMKVVSGFTTSPFISSKG
jgi:hypothetical protein